MAIRRKRIRTAAQDLLQRHGVSKVPVPVPQIAKACGARIYYQSLEGELSGFLYADAEQPVIGVNTHHSSARQAFTIAHELGHLLLHENQAVHVDHNFRVHLRSKASSQGTDEREVEANLFAAELLMPAHFLERDIKGADSLGLVDDVFISELSRRYGVSTQALLIRLSYLGYIQE